LPPWMTLWLGLPEARGPYYGDPRHSSRRRPSSSWWSPPPRPSGTRWPLGWRDAASGWRRGPRRPRRAGAPLEPRTPGSQPQPLHPTVEAATSTPPGEPRRRGTPPRQGVTPQRRRRRVGRRARRGGLSPRAGGQPTSTHSTLPSAITTGGMPATMSRCRRTGVSRQALLWVLNLGLSGIFRNSISPGYLPIIPTRDGYQWHTYCNPQVKILKSLNIG